MSTRTVALTEAKRLLEQRRFKEALSAIDPAELDDPIETAEACLMRTEAMLALGTYDSTFVDRALEILRPLGNIKLFALAKYLRARLQFISGDLTDAQENLTEAYVYYKRVDDLRGMGRTANLQSIVAYHQSDFFAFSRYARTCLDCYRRNGDDEQVAMVLLNMAMSEIRLGHLRRARERLDEVDKNYLDSLREGYKYNFYHVSSILSAQLGLSSGALRMIRAADKLSKDLKRELCRHFETDGYVRILAGDCQGAEESLKTGLESAQEIETTSGSPLFSQIKRLFGDLYVATHRWDLAEKFATEALAIAEKINERLEVAACYRIFAQVEQHRGNDEKAREWFRKAIDLFSLISARYELAVTQYLAATSGLYDNGERIAMLALSREYFASEDINHYVEKIDELLRKYRPLQKTTHRLGVHPPTIVAVNPRMKELLKFAEDVAQSDMTVLLTGETGTGKDLFAEYIHYGSGRRGAFVTFNAAAVPDTMVESQLFGSVRGAFTGSCDRAGLFEAADNGTFLLNEIADTTPEFQAKLLEVLETGRVLRLGETKPRKVNFRLIAATNHDLQQRMRDNLFRPDLFHRLNEVHIDLPSLDQRKEDIPALVEHFLREFCPDLKAAGGNPRVERLGLLLSLQDWPGNVRELRGALKRLHLKSNGHIPKMIDILLKSDQESDQVLLLKVLELTGWNRSEAAQILGVSEGAIRKRIKKYKLHKP